LDLLSKFGKSGVKIDFSCIKYYWIF